MLFFVPVLNNNQCVMSCVLYTLQKCYRLSLQIVIAIIILLLKKANVEWTTFNNEMISIQKYINIEGILLLKYQISLFLSFYSYFYHIFWYYNSNILLTIEDMWKQQTMAYDKRLPYSSSRGSAFNSSESSTLE